MANTYESYFRRYLDDPISIDSGTPPYEQIITGPPGPAGPAGPVGPTGPIGPPGPINAIQNQGVGITLEPTLNFTGAGVSASVDSANNRINVIVAGGNAVTSVFGRQGAVIATNGDYAASQITNAVDSSQIYNNPSWIGSIPWTKVTGSPSVGSYQTPWLQQIDAAMYKLTDCGGVGIGSGVIPDSINALKVFVPTVQESIATSNTTSLGRSGMACSNDVNDSFHVYLAGSGVSTVGNSCILDAKNDSSQPLMQILFMINSVEKFRIDSTGRICVNMVGIPPTYQLEVNGDCNITGTYRVNGVAIGTGGGAVSSVFGRTGAVVAVSTDYSAFYMSDPTTTKGDLIVHGATTTRLPVSATDGWVLTADSSQTLGVKWAAAPGGAGGTPAGSQGYIQFNNAGAFGANANLFWDNTNSRLGVGSGSPAKSLDVNGVITLQDGSTRTLPAGITTELNSQILDIGINDDSSGRFGPYNSAKQGGFLRFETRGDPAFSFFVRPAGSTSGATGIVNITTTGYVGIGSVSPVNPLVINTSTTDSRLSIHNSTSTDVVSRGLHVVLSGAGAYLWNYENGPLNFSTNNAQYMTIVAGGNVGIGTASAGFSVGELVTINTVASGAKAYALALVNAAGATGTEVALAFTPNTNIPLAEISAYRNSGGPTDLVFRTWASTMTEKMRITASGGVGIGTPSPQALLTVAKDVTGQVGATNTCQCLVGGASDQNKYLYLGFDTTNEWGIVGAAWSGHAAEPLLINPAGGNVGVGLNTAPLNVLHIHGGTNENLLVGPNINVSGAVTISAVNDANSANTPLEIRGNPTVFQIGNVGIGKSPSYALDISGDCNITGTYRVNGTPIATGGSGGITTKNVVTGSRANSIVYTNSSGKPMFVSVSCYFTAAGYGSLAADTSNPPTTVISQVTNANGSTAEQFTLCGWVMNGENYKVIINGFTSVTWIEWT